MCLNMWQSLSRRIFPHSVRPAIIDTTLFFSTSDLFSSPAPRAGNIQCIYRFQQNALVCFEIHFKRLYWCYRDRYLFWWLRSFSGGGTLDSTPPISAISCVWGNQSFIFTFTFYRVFQKKFLIEIKMSSFKILLHWSGVGQSGTKCGVGSHRTCSHFLAHSAYFNIFRQKIPYFDASQ